MDKLYFSNKFFSTIKNNMTQVVLFVLLVGFCFPIPISTEYTSSGIIILYLSDFLAVVLVILSTISVYRDRNQKDAWHKMRAMTCVFFWILVVWCVILTIYRFLADMVFYKAFMNFFRTSVPVCAMGAVLQKDKIKNNIVVLNVSLSVIFIVVMITNLVNNTVVTDILINRNMVVYICILGIFTSALLLFYGQCSTMQKISIAFNTVFSIVYCITSGSRMGAYVSIFSIVGIALIFFRKKTFLLYALYSLSAALIISIMMYTHICDAHFWVLRGFNINTVATSISAENNTDISDSSDKKYVDLLQSIRNEEKTGEELSQEEILIINDIGRIEAWKNGIQRIRENPFFGTGDISVFKSEGGNQSSHNFLIDYAITYGLVGLVLWVIFVLVMIVPILKKATWKERGLILFVLSTIFGMALLQPFLTTCIGPYVAWLLLYLLCGRVSIEVDSKKIDNKIKEN